MMGSLPEESLSVDSERPQHLVQLQGFFLAQSPITQGQWLALMHNNPSGFSDQPDSTQRPVEKVTWNNAMEFCNRLNQSTGRRYTLPSEAQWEYACRAGSSTPFAYGATLSAELANYDATSTYDDGPKGEYRQQTTPVGMFPANAWGLQDMHGNVWEWCLDEWQWSYEGAPTDGSAWQSGGDGTKLLRGGCWEDDPRPSRSAFRHRFQPVPTVSAYDIIGFRVVCLPQGPSLNA
jgi:formylglycine-generating enzyme required for sulfatase activity